MTQFIYGGFVFDANSVAVTGFSSSFIRSPTGRTHLLRKSMSLEGKIIRSSMSAVLFQMSSIQEALSVNGQSAAMLDNSGLRTPWVLDSPSAIGGVIVTRGASNQNVKGAEGVTYLRYTFALEADYRWAGGSDVLSFSESLSFSDNQGLPLQVVRIPANGDPIVQNVTQSSGYHCTQSGSMTQAGPNPQPTSPTFPGLFIGNEGSHQITMLPTKAIRGVPIEYGVSWKYEFFSITPFAGGSPNYR